MVGPSVTSYFFGLLPCGNGKPDFQFFPFFQFLPVFFTKEKGKKTENPVSHPRMVRATYAMYTALFIIALLFQQPKCF